MATKPTRAFDATLKELLRLRPRDALSLIGLENVLDVKFEDTDLSTLMAVADKVLRVRITKGEFLVHSSFRRVTTATRWSEFFGTMQRCFIDTIYPCGQC